jgi:thioredoxin 1
MIRQLTDSMAPETRPMVIKAFATWCPHCTTMKPVFEELEKELGKEYVFAEFDIDVQKPLVQKWEVTSLPTFLFIKEGKEVGREIGAMPQETLKEKILTYLR